jgi:hypothetical protein
MTVLTTTAKAGPYAGSGTTGPFTVPFRFLDASHLRVIRNVAGIETVLTLGTDYTVAGVGATSGSVTLVAALTSGQTLTVVRNVPATQDADYVAGDAFPAESHEEALDKLTMLTQQLQEEVARSAKLPASNTADADTLSAALLQVAGNEANINAVAGNASNINAVAGNASNINTVSGSIANVNATGSNIANVNAVAGNASNINAVAGNNANVTTVAGSIANVNAVGTNIANVNAVNANASNINAAVSNATNINTVAGISADVTAVAGIAGDVAAVENIAANVTAVAGNATNINAVAGNASNINAVAGNQSNINAVNANQSNINTVAGINAAVSTVAGNNANVSTVAGISSNVTAVAGNAANITAVAGNATNINAVVANQADIDTVAGISAAVSAVAGNETNINAVNANAANINAVVANATNINTVAGIDADVTAVGAVAADIPTVAANVADIHNFADVWQGAKATAPTQRNDSSALQAGDLYYDTVLDEVRVYTGTVWKSAGSTVNGTAVRQTFTATAGQTSFTVTGGYDAGFADVYLNGVKLVNGVDVTVTSGTAVVLTSGAALNDVVDVIAYGSFLIANTYSIAHADALLAAKQAASPVLTSYVDNSIGFRNRIINGDMRIDQRNAGASVTPTNGQYLVDRWVATLTNASRFSAQQNAGAVTPPAGFSHYLGVVSLSAYAVTASDTFAVQQRIEGFNVSDLGWGTAGARPVTLSFWARSSLAGSFGGALTNSAANRSYPFSYAIAAANTWELKTVTIPGDTSGTWLADNGVGVALRFGLGSGSNFTAAAGAWGAGNIVQPTGSVSVVGTNGATWQVTGVQLEAGSVATPFERRPYGTEEMLCKRYAQPFGGGLAGRVSGATTADVTGAFKVPMRASPTLTLGGFSGAATQLTQAGIAVFTPSSFIGSVVTPNHFYMVAVSTGLTTGAIVLGYQGDIAFASAEL